MKKIFLRLAVLSILLFALFQIREQSVLAAYCWEGVYAGWNNCDNNYSATINAHWNSPNTCNSQATAACANDPNPSSCYTTQYNNCIQASQNTYDNRGMDYGSCISGVFSSNCVEQLDYCDQARSRRDGCILQYSGTDDADAYYACWSASGIHLCE
ncbi:MAG TPA: hypothetical protein VGB68_06160 [Pyrinomonadaceae bacterium]